MLFHAEPTRDAHPLPAQRKEEPVASSGLPSSRGVETNGPGRKDIQLASGAPVPKPSPPTGTERKGFPRGIFRPAETPAKKTIT